RQTERRRGRPALAIAASAAAIVLAAFAFTLVATVGHDWLPAVMRGNGYTAELIFVVSSVWVLSLLALLALARRRPYAALDLWLMVGICAWLFDVPFSAVLNPAR